jgi:DNA adenine methylase
MTYPGGKNGAGVYQAIINRMPPHRVYIEPFLGGGAIMRLKRPAAVNIGLDLDADVIRRFRRWRPIPADSAMLAIGGTGQTGEGGQPRQKRRADPTAGSDDAAGRIAGSGDGRRRVDPNPPEKARSSPRARKRDASSYRFEIADAMAFLRDYPYVGDELVYCDPPYMHETRGRRNLYRFEMEDAQHEDLLALLKGLPCRVMLSGYWTRLYARVLKRWDSFTFSAVNRAGQRTTEWVWSNFAEPVALHDYRYLGANFRERERIKRKKARWVNRLVKMPTLERKALLSAIDEAWHEKRAG